VSALALVALVVPLANAAPSSVPPTYVAPGVYQAAESHQGGTIRVIIQSAHGFTGAETALQDVVRSVREAADAARREADEAARAEAEARRAAADADRAAEVQSRADADARKEAAAAKKTARDAKATQAKKAAAAARADRAARAAEQASGQAGAASEHSEEARKQADQAAAEAAAAAAEAESLDADQEPKLDQELRLISAISVEIPARQVKRLARLPGLTVTLDAEVETSAYSATQLWPYQNGASKFWGTDGVPGPKPPAIAIVDSGIDKGVVSFGDGHRIVTRQVFTSLPQDGSRLDGRGHGTFVAGIAAGEAAGFTGVAPRADLVDLDVMDDQGMARTSDVVKACEWILQNKDAKNIRVANFSLHSSSVLSIRYHPLNKAVEKLWFAGVVVVAAAGNYGTPNGPSGVVHAPGNDPFAITVGAYDLEGSPWIGRHDVPSWSAYGYTNEGFAKPDVVAAGRYLVAPAPVGASLGVEKAERVVAPGQLKLSGTSFAAPIVSGMAAQILARNPGWSADQVKGALMKTARRMPDAAVLEQGRGEVNLVRAISETNPPNPNAVLERFVVPDALGGSGRLFDATAWYGTMRSDAAWDSAAWDSAAWNDAAWNDAAWADAAWADAAWNDAAWNDAAWSDSTTYEDAVDGEPDGAPELVTPEQLAVLESDPALAVGGNGTTP
jgi:serine protease AprX